MTEPIYHLAPAARWNSWPTDEPYLPVEYGADGFIHCTAGEELMLTVANRFYRAVPGEFLVLRLDPARLTSELRWELSADALAREFPHIYGPINHAAVQSVHPVTRDAAGTFLGWE